MTERADAEGGQGSGWRSRCYRLRDAASRIESVVRCGGKVGSAPLRVRKPRLLQRERRLLRPLLVLCRRPPWLPPAKRSPISGPGQVSSNGQ
jgi:hypothetical protein